MALKEKKYLNDQTIIKVYDNKIIKVIHQNCLRNSGIEEPKKQKILSDSSTDFENCRTVSKNVEKYTENILRAKRTVYDLAMCNSWQWFFTGTLDSKKYDRENIDSIKVVFTQWIRNINKKYNLAIKYVIVPELHSDNKSWHFHGLLNGLPSDLLVPFKIGDSMSSYLVKKVQNGSFVYNWTEYQNKFGFCCLEPVRDIKASAAYISKYVSKDFDKGVTDLFKHKFYASTGLKRPVIVAKGSCDFPFDWDYTNDYCSIKSFDFSEDLLETLKGNIY